MRTPLALLVSIALALAHAGDVGAQDEGDGSNPRTKTESPGQPAATARLPPDLVDLAKKAAALADAGGDELPEARRLLGNLRADARFDALPQDFRFRVLGVAGFVEMSDSQPEVALALFRQALELQDDDPDLWYWRSAVELDLD